MVFLLLLIQKPNRQVDDSILDELDDVDEAALKLDKLQEIEKLKPVVVRRTSNRNSTKL